MLCRIIRRTIRRMARRTLFQTSCKAVQAWYCRRGSTDWSLQTEQCCMSGCLSGTLRTKSRTMALCMQAPAEGSVRLRGPGPPHTPGQLRPGCRRLDVCRAAGPGQSSPGKPRATLASFSQLRAGQASEDCRTKVMQNCIKSPEKEENFHKTALCPLPRDSACR